MSRLTNCFQHLQTQQRTALIPFITAGDPTSADTIPLMHALVAAGADIIELGIPFSDPMADGPVIQRSHERALISGTCLRDVLEIVRIFRQQDTHTPIVLMGYLNPIETMGYALFAQQAQIVGVDGLLVVDLPPEEADELTTLLRKHELSPIFLLAPTSTTERIKRICQQASGYLYYVSLKGVTGSAHLEIASVANKIAEIRQHTSLPIGVGFGIHDAETAAQIAKVSDAVIVGSALISRIETTSPDKLLAVLSEFLRGLRIAIDAI